MKLLVTGGAGDIGGKVVAELRSRHDVTILDRRPSDRHPDLPLLEVNLEDPLQTKSSVRGFDAVVHLAAIPDPVSDPPDIVFRVNTMATFNLLEAVLANRIRRVVYGCSESASGFGIHNTVLKPLRIPIDERQPSWPHEAYSLSKYFGEVICEQYSRAYGIEVISLRYAWVWGGARNRPAWSKVIAEGSRGGQKDWLGAWIAVDDVAQAAGLACEFQFSDQEPRFEAFYLTARENFTELATLELLNQSWPDDPPPISNPDLYKSNPKASAFDISKAQRLLGYEPSVTIDDLAKRFEIERKPA